MAVGDFNGDGKQDIVAANFTTNNVSVLLRNAANNGFDPELDYPVGSSLAGVAVGDINGEANRTSRCRNFGEQYGLGLTQKRSQ